MTTLSANSTRCIAPSAPSTWSSQFRPIDCPGFSSFPGMFEGELDQELRRERPLRVLLSDTTVISPRALPSTVASTSRMGSGSHPSEL